MILILLLSIARSALPGACLEVDGERIRTTHMAAAVPAFEQVDEPLGFAPAPGAKRVFTGAEIKRHLQRLRLPVGNSYYENVCVERRMVSYDRQIFTEALTKALGPDSAKFEVLRFGPLQGPAGTIEFSRRGFVRVAAGQAGTGLWKGRLRYSTSGSVPVWAEIRFAEEAEVLVTRADLPAGHILESGDLQTQRRSADPFNRQKPLTVPDVVGMALRRSIRAGTLIGLAALTSPPDVKRGDAVRIEAQVGAASLRVEGIAQGAGRIGQEIAVKNLQNGGLLKARILSAGVVSVSGGGNE